MRVPAFHLSCSWLDSCQPWKWTPSHQLCFLPSWWLSWTPGSLTVWRNFSFFSFLLYLHIRNTYFLLERKDSFVTIWSDSRVTILQEWKARAPKDSVCCPVWLLSRQRQSSQERQSPLKKEPRQPDRPYQRGELLCRVTARGVTSLLPSRAEPQRLLARQIHEMSSPCCSAASGRVSISLLWPRKLQTLVTSAKLSDVLPPAPSWASGREA